MALKDIFSLFDAKLADTFHLRAYDATADRAKLVKRLQSTKDKFLATEAPRGRKDFEVANNIVAFSPMLGAGIPMILSGQTTNFVPAERFPEVLDKLIAAVEAGELDGELEAASKGESVTGSTPALPKVKATRKPREGGGAGWSEARKAKFQATIAARKATKD